jgi:NitT/TauT family transport system permease protein
VGEFVGTDKGLGYVLQTANGRLDTNMLFAAILFLVVIGIVSFLLVDVVERLAIPWHVSMRKDLGAPTPDGG